MSRVNATKFNFVVSFVSNPRWEAMVEVDSSIYTIKLDQSVLNLPLRKFLYSIQRFVNETEKKR